MPERRDARSAAWRTPHAAPDGGREAGETGGGAAQALERLARELAAEGIAVALAGPSGALVWANRPMDELAGGAAAGRRLDELIEPSASGGVSVRGAPGRSFRHAAIPAEGSSTLHLLIERSRHEREVYFARAVEDSVDAIVSLDTRGRIRYWNRGAEQMFGYAAGEVLGRPYGLLVPPELEEEGELDRIDEIIARQGALRNFETVRLAKDGRPVEVDITVTQLLGEDGASLGRSVIYRDISLRRWLEAELRKNLDRLEALKSELSRKVTELRRVNLTLRRNQKRLISREKLSAIGEITAKVAHEIRTPLVTIGGFSHTLWKSMPEDAPQRDYLKIIREEVRRLEDIVAEILDYVRPGKIQTEPCDLNELVRETLRPHLEELAGAGIQVEERLDPALPVVQANRTQIGQVVTNLVVNARQAMLSPAAGAGPRRLTVATAPGENHVSISVSDSGPGIPERHKERVFRPFFTTRPGGSGLGLAIASQIAAQHHATLTFESSPGRGTTFHLRLPARREPAAGKAR